MTDWQVHYYFPILQQSTSCIFPQIRSIMSSTFCFWEWLKLRSFYELYFKGYWSERKFLLRRCNQLDIVRQTNYYSIIAYTQSNCMSHWPSPLRDLPSAKNEIVKYDFTHVLGSIFRRYNFWSRLEKIYFNLNDIFLHLFIKLAKEKNRTFRIQYLLDGNFKWRVHAMMYSRTERRVKNMTFRIRYLLDGNF